MNQVNSSLWGVFSKSSVKVIDSKIPKIYSTSPAAVRSRRYLAENPDQLEKARLRSRKATKSAQNPQRVAHQLARKRRNTVMRNTRVISPYATREIINLFERGKDPITIAIRTGHLLSYVEGCISAYIETKRTISLVK